MKIRIHYNAPVILTFAILSLGVLILDFFTGGWSTRTFFCVYHAPLNEALTYVRLFGHVLGHADYSHYIGNMMLLLVVGPPLEERYTQKNFMVVAPSVRKSSTSTMRDSRAKDSTTGAL